MLFRSILEIPPSACLFPINLAALRVLGLSIFRRMIEWISRRSQHLVFYCHPSEFLYARDQTFPRAMSRWNQWGMCPSNLILVEALVDSVLKLEYAPVPMVQPAPRSIDLKQPTILRAVGYQSDPA